MGVYENCEQTYSDKELVPQQTGIRLIQYNFNINSNWNSNKI